jgi:cell division transport system permease protein
MASTSFYLREALTSLRRGGASNALAVATTALALFVLGAFLLVTASLDRVMAGWSSSAEMSVYLRDDVSAEQRSAIEAAIGDSRLVDRREFVSKEEAARRFRRDFPDLAAAADSLAANPLPASYELRLRAKDVVAAPDVEHLARSVGGLSGVSDVRYDRQWLDRLARVVGTLRLVGFALAAALAVAAGLTAAAVVRLAMVGRQDEMEIMTLVGAPFAAMRGPFILEGVLQGGIGAIAAVVLLRVVHQLARTRLVADIPGLDASMIPFLSPVALAAIVVGGLVVGCLGGLIATRAVR